MHALRTVVLIAVALKLSVAVSTWWTAPAWAESEPVATGAVPRDLLARSRGFRDLLRAVRDRGTELDERAAALGSREAALRALEKTIAAEVTRLEQFAGVAPPTTGGATRSDAPAGVPTPPALAKVYASMRAEEAGPILDRLDEDVVKAILVRMKERQVAAILAAMSRERAVALTKALAKAP